MVQKPKIQYIGQFYVHGSEARKLEQQQAKQAKTTLPAARRQKIEKVYVDPVALAGIVVAVVMLVVMVVGALQIRDDWAEYEQMSNYVSQLKRENAKLEHDYRAALDLEDIRTKAEALGMIPKEELGSVSVSVTIPERAPEIGRVEEIKGFLEDMFA